MSQQLSMNMQVSFRGVVGLVLTSVKNEVNIKLRRSSGSALFTTRPYSDHRPANSPDEEAKKGNVDLMPTRSDDRRPEQENNQRHSTRIEK